MTAYDLQVGGANVQRFTYPQSTMIGNNAPDMNNTVFTFPAPPQGYIATGSFLPCVTPTASFTTVSPQLSNIADTVWTLFVDGVATVTWVGYATLDDFQVSGGQVVTVRAQYLPPSCTVLLTWFGFTAPEANALVATPAITQSGQLESIPQSSFLIETQINDSTGSGDFEFTYTPTNNNYAIACVQAELSTYYYPGSNTNVNAEFIYLTAASGPVIASVGLGGGSGRSDHSDIVVNYYDKPVVLVGPSTGLTNMGKLTWGPAPAGGGAITAMIAILTCVYLPVYSFPV